MHALISISNTVIRQDDAGRYCLNDLHRAAGGAKRHRPGYWLANRRTKDLIGEIEKGLPEIRHPPVQTMDDGRDDGTYVCDDLVIAYATWVDPKFYLRVIRAYKEQTGRELRQTVGLMHQRLALETRDASSKVRASFGSKLMSDRKRELPALKQERSVLELEMNPDMFKLGQGEPA